jgi:ribosomal protein S18 acetylase RimI-like enzyme
VIAKVASGKRKTGIRPLDPGRDLGQLADLVEHAFGQELTGEGERVLRELRWLGRLGPLNYVLIGAGSEASAILNGFVWEQDGRIVGNVTVNCPGGYAYRWQISNVAVLEAFRGQGIAHALLEAAIDLILRNGGRTAYLFVREDNPVAIHLYQSMGFRELDRTTELVLDRRLVHSPVPQPLALRPLQPKEGEMLYRLVVEAVGPGERWLHRIRRERYVLSWERRLSRRLEALFTAETETLWGMWRGDALDAGLSLRATSRWNVGPHRLQLWVRPDRRGEVENALARDIVALLARQAPRPVHLGLPACEQKAIEALLMRGFHELRTLILMKMEL